MFTMLFVFRRYDHIAVRNSHKIILIDAEQRRILIALLLQFFFSDVAVFVYRFHFNKCTEVLHLVKMEFYIADK